MSELILEELDNNKEWTVDSPETDEFKEQVQKDFMDFAKEEVTEANYHVKLKSLHHLFHALKGTYLSELADALAGSIMKYENKFNLDVKHNEEKEV